VWFQNGSAKLGLAASYSLSISFLKPGACCTLEVLCRLTCAFACFHPQAYLSFE